MGKGKGTNIIIIIKYSGVISTSEIPRFPETQNGLSEMTPYNILLFLLYYYYHYYHNMAHYHTFNQLCSICGNLVSIVSVAPLDNQGQVLFNPEIQAVKIFLKFMLCLKSKNLCQAAKLSICQALKVSSCQAVKLSSCQSVKLFRWSSC